MVQFGAVKRVLSLLAGVGILVLGITWLAMAASGAVKTGQSLAYVAGAGFLLASTPLLAFPFSMGLAKRLAVLTLLILASGTVWLAFRPGVPTDRPVLAQIGAIAFAVLLIARVGFALRRRHSRLVT